MEGWSKQNNQQKLYGLFFLDVLQWIQQEDADKGSAYLSHISGKKESCVIIHQNQRGIGSVLIYIEHKHTDADNWKEKHKRIEV